MQHLTISEARRLEHLVNMMHRKIRIASSAYNSDSEFNGNEPIWELRQGVTPRNQRMRHRNVQRAERAFRAYERQLTERLGTNTLRRNYYNYLRSRTRSRAVVRKVFLEKQPRSRMKINQDIESLMYRGMSRQNATRRVLKNIAETGARTVVAIRSLQRAFRARRAAQKSPLHVEMRGLRTVPVSGIRMNNGNIRPLKPSDVKKAREYLKKEGFRVSIRSPKRFRVKNRDV